VGGRGAAGAPGAGGPTARTGADDARAARGARPAAADSARAAAAGARGQCTIADARRALCRRRCSCWAPPCPAAGAGRTRRRRWRRRPAAAAPRRPAGPTRCRPPARPAPPLPQPSRTALRSGRRPWQRCRRTLDAARPLGVKQPAPAPLSLALESPQSRAFTPCGRMASSCWFLKAAASRGAAGCAERQWSGTRAAAAARACSFLVGAP